MCDVDIAAKSTKISPNLQMFTRLHCSTHLSKRQSFLEELKVERRKSYVQRTTCWPNGIIFSTLPTKLHQTFLDVFSRKIEQKKHANVFQEILFSTENLIPEKSLLEIFLSSGVASFNSKVIGLWHVIASILYRATLIYIHSPIIYLMVQKNKIGTSMRLCPC